MARTYNKFNSTRSKAEFARNALAGTIVASDSTNPVADEVGSTTGWAAAATKVTLSAAPAAYLGDSSDWGETDGGNIILEPGTYQFNVLISVKNTTAGAISLLWALTDDAYATLYESTLTVPLVISSQNENGVLSGFFQIELAAQTEVAFHVGIVGVGTATKNRGEQSQILIRKIA